MTTRVKCCDRDYNNDGNCDRHQAANTNFCPECREETFRLKAKGATSNSQGTFTLFACVNCFFREWKWRIE